MAAYYNEIDPYAAQWLRNLIDAGHIAPGIVDERSIEDVHPNELREFTQCHFFAGIGVWSLALRRAGWPDDRPVWTGSCPCQPFSAAGAGAGFEDARHLWPTFAWLIKQCKPAIIFGEQVASKAVEPWVDLVHADVEALGYAFGAVPFPSAGVGAPHIRDRLYWVADSKSDRYEWPGKLSQSTGRDGSSHLRTIGGVDNADDTRPQGHARHGGSAERKGSDRPATATNLSSGLADLHGDGCDQGRKCRSSTGNDGAERDSAASGMGNADCKPARGNSGAAHTKEIEHGSPDSHGNGLRDAGNSLASHRTSGPTNGVWADADWLFCRDGKWRPVEPGTFPLAHGAASRVGSSGADWRSPAGEEEKGNRVGRLRGYGNAINAEAARIFIEAYLDAANG